MKMMFGGRVSVAARLVAASSAAIATWEPNPVTSRLAKPNNNRRRTNGGVTFGFGWDGGWQAMESTVGASCNLGQGRAGATFGRTIVAMNASSWPELRRDTSLHPPGRQKVTLSRPSGALSTRNLRLAMVADVQFSRRHLHNRDRSAATPAGRLAIDPQPLVLVEFS